MLVALLLLLVFTLRTAVVSIFSSISCPLVVVISMVFINNPGVMSNNTRMVIARLLFFMAIGLGNILTLLNISNIYNNFIINITFFMFLFFWDLMALLVLLVMTMRTIMLLILNMSMVTMARISCTRHKSNRQGHFDSGFGGSFGGHSGGGFGGSFGGNSGGGFGGGFGFPQFYSGGQRSNERNWGPTAWGPGLKNPWAFPLNPFVMQRAVGLTERCPGTLARVGLDGEVKITDYSGFEVEILDWFGNDITEGIDEFDFFEEPSYHFFMRGASGFGGPSGFGSPSGFGISPPGFGVSPDTGANNGGNPGASTRSNPGQQAPCFRRPKFGGFWDL